MKFIAEGFSKGFKYYLGDDNSLLKLLLAKATRPDSRFKFLGFTAVYFSLFFKIFTS